MTRTRHPFLPALIGAALATATLAGCSSPGSWEKTGTQEAQRSSATTAMGDLAAISENLDRISASSDRALPASLTAEAREASQTLAGAIRDETRLSEAQQKRLLHEVSGPIWDVTAHLIGESRAIAARKNLVTTDTFNTSAEMLRQANFNARFGRGPATQSYALLSGYAAEYTEILEELPKQGEGEIVAYPKPEFKKESPEPKTADAPVPKKAGPAPAEAITIEDSPHQEKQCDDRGEVLLRQRFDTGDQVSIDSTVPWTSTTSQDGTVTVYECLQ